MFKFVQFTWTESAAARRKKNISAQTREHRVTEAQDDLALLHKNAKCFDLKKFKSDFYVFFTFSSLLSTWNICWLGKRKKVCSRDKMMSDEFSSQLCFFYDIHDLVNNFVSHSYRVTYFYFISGVEAQKKERKTHREPWLGAEKRARGWIVIFWILSSSSVERKVFSCFFFLLSFFGSHNKSSRALWEFIRPPLDWWWENNSTRDMMTKT